VERGTHRQPHCAQGAQLARCLHRTLHGSNMSGYHDLKHLKQLENCLARNADQAK
jgi:hypothetical protein